MGSVSRPVALTLKSSEIALSQMTLSDVPDVPESTVGSQKCGREPLLKLREQKGRAYFA